MHRVVLLLSLGIASCACQSLPAWYSSGRDKMVAEADNMRFDTGTDITALHTDNEHALNAKLIGMKLSLQNNDTFISAFEFDAIKDK